MLKGLHFLLTYRCTHECDHCFVHGSPRARGVFTRRNVERVLDQGVAVGSVERIYFEGGEPFLYYPLLLDGLRAARDRGFATGVVTNAYWAETVEDAELWLRPLRDLGVADFTVSDDPLHHGPDGGETPAARALEAARRLGIPSGSICLPHPQEGEGVCFRGRAADTLSNGLPRLPGRSFRECTDEELRAPERVHVDAWGHVHICQGILIGNCFDTPLRDILAGYVPELHPICGPLVAGGPAALAEETGLDREGTYVSACHYCYRTRELLRDRYPEFLGPPQVYGADA